MVTIELKPGGADVPVTQENKKEYVDHVVDYRISKRVKEQFDAFMSGFSELIPQDLITVFDERELELLIGGMSEIDVYVILFFSHPTKTHLTIISATIGRSSRITVVMRWMMKLSSGSGSVCAAGHPSANHAFSSSPRVPQEYQSTGSKICRALMGPDALLLKSRAIHHNYLRVTHASTALISLLTRIMQVSNTSLHLPSSMSVPLFKSPPF
jgi:HECT-domain (ubiquitin-transferase)